MLPPAGRRSICFQSRFSGSAIVGAARGPSSGENGSGDDLRWRCLLHHITNEKINSCFPQTIFTSRRACDLLDAASRSSWRKPPDLTKGKQYEKQNARRSGDDLCLHFFTPSLER